MCLILNSDTHNMSHCTCRCRNAEGTQFTWLHIQYDHSERPVRLHHVDASCMVNYQEYCIQFT